MEKCKFCQAELAENGTVCPSCGRDNAEEIVTEEATAVAEEVTGEPAPAEEISAEEIPAEEISAEAPSAEEPTTEEAPAEEIPAEETPADAAPEKKATPTKIALAVTAVVVLIAMLIALIVPGMTKKEETEQPAESAALEETVAPATVPADGNPEDITCKGTYTVADDVASQDGDVVVARIGDAELTNGQLRIYYRSALSSFLNTEYGYMMLMYGMLDYTQPLDTQISAQDETLTWQQFFLKYALENWQLTQALAVEAEKAGVPMSEEETAYLDGLEDSLAELAESNGMTVEDMLKADFGEGVSFEDFLDYQRQYMAGNPYYEKMTSEMVATDEELEAYFKENEEAYAAAGITMDSKLVDVRHILIQVEGGTADETGNITYSEEDWAACEAEAQAILDEWLAGDKTEESFAALANEKSEDPGSNTAGGLYENVYVGQMVEPFENWCFEESRQYGDTGLVQTSYGYHVMYYVGYELNWKQTAQTDWLNDQISTFLNEIVEEYPMDVTYENITLGAVSLA